MIAPLSWCFTTPHCHVLNHRVQRTHSPFPCFHWNALCGTKKGGKPQKGIVGNVYVSSLTYNIGLLNKYVGCVPLNNLCKVSCSSLDQVVLLGHTDWQKDMAVGTCYLVSPHVYAKLDDTGTFSFIVRDNQAQIIRNSTLSLQKLPYVLRRSGSL